MECTLCGKAIEGYRPEYHLFVIDDARSAPVCPECIDKFVRWRQRVLTELFPTKAAKRFRRGR